VTRTDMPNTVATEARHRYARHLRWGCPIVVLLVLGVTFPASPWRPDTVFDGQTNVQIGEAQAWWQGRLDLPRRSWDTALHQGKVYSYFPPAFTLIAAGLVPFADGVPQPAVACLAMLLALLLYRLFLSLTESPVWAALLAVGFVLGTSAWPVLTAAVRDATPYHVNHMLALIGVALMLCGFFGRPRIGVMALGLALAVWSRQMTAAYSLPLLWLAWNRQDRVLRLRGLATAVAGILVIGAVSLALNVAKFGHPLRTGYMLNHEQREDVFAREARAFGLLSLHWVPRNLYYANLGPPQWHRVQSEGRTQHYLRPNEMGTGIWWTTPLLLWLLVDIRSIWGDPRRRIWLISAGAVFAMLSLWHATGAVQRGYNRYSLDYMLVLWALLVPGCISPKRRWIAALMVVWSVLYFRVLLTWPHVRVW